MKTPSRMVVDRQKIAHQVSAQAGTHADRLALDLGTRFAADLGEGETMPDWALIQRLLARHLDRLGGDMVTRDDAHIVAQTRDLEPRERRDKAVERVRGSLSELRRIADAYFGFRGLELVPVVGRTATLPEALWRQAAHTVLRITSAGETLPPPKIEGGPTDLTPWVTELESATAELRTALDELALLRAETDASLEAKHDSMTAVDQASRGSARILQGIFLLTGKDHLAERLQAVFRRRRTGGEEDTEPGLSEPGGDEPAESDADEGSAPTTSDEIVN